jgi:ribonuclease HI
LTKVAQVQIALTTSNNKSVPTTPIVCRDYLLALSDKKFDYTIVCDGSGYTDHVGGFGAIILGNKNNTPVYETAYGCSTHMETGRAEFTAILTGLGALMYVKGWREDLKTLALFKKHILIISDRQDLVGSINNYYSRKANRDLWVSFEWYEKYFSIEAVHVKRETVPMHQVADRMASELRMQLKAFEVVQKECGNL